MKRIKIFAVVALLFLSACTTEDVVKVLSADEVSAAIYFIDDDGRTISLETPCTRIISLYSAHTENIYVLGAGDLLIGGHTTCIYPPEAAFLDMFDYQGDPEAIIAAEPDLVLIRPFISRRAPEYVETLEKAGIMVVSLYPENYEAFPSYIERLALLTGTADVAEEKLAAFYEEIDQISEMTAHAEERRTLFFEATETAVRTVTADSMPAMAIQFAGGVNIADDVTPTTPGSTIAEYGVERVLENAEYIDVYVSQRGAMNAGGNLISIGQRPGYHTIKAVQDGNVFLINEKIISSPTFRYSKGVHELARFLYPSLIDDLSAYENNRWATKRDFANIIVRYLHLPIYMPASSRYYQTEQKGHTYGLFEDVSWMELDFDFIETAVYAGYVDWEMKDGKEYFDPEALITKDVLAKSLFIMGDFKNQETHIEILDLDQCENSRIIQILVDNGVFLLKDGYFNPQDNVTQKEILRLMAFL